MAIAEEQAKWMWVTGGRLEWIACLVATMLPLMGSAKASAAEVDPFAGFMNPVSNPVQFEDPRATTEIRPLYVYHKLDSGFANVLGGTTGDASVVALQARVAVTDRLALIATKDGYVWIRPAGAPNSDGWANIGLGAKYNFYRDPELLTLATVGLRYEIPSGNRDVFQGQLANKGDGVINPFLSGAWGIKDLAGIGDFHLIGYTGARIPVNGGDSTFFDLSVHADWGLSIGPEALGPIYPLVEINWVQTLDGGSRLPIDKEGFDFFNLGASGAGGKGVVTMAVGARYPLCDNLGEIMGRAIAVELGAAWEAPLTDRGDIFGWRVTTDLIFKLR